MSDDSERIEKLETRLAALEAVFIEPRATVPPITVGELADVPAPGSAIASQWAQEVTNRAVHRFATKAALDGWAAADGSLGYVAALGGTLYVRRGGLWLPTGGALPYAVVNSGVQTIASGQVVARQWATETSDPWGLFTGAANTKFTIPAGLGGLWLFQYQIEFNNFGLGARGAFLRLNNGATRPGWQQVQHSTATINAAVNGSALIAITATNDFVECCCWQDSGGAMNIGAFGMDTFTAVRLS